MSLFRGALTVAMLVSAPLAAVDQAHALTPAEVQVKVVELVQALRTALAGVTTGDAARVAIAEATRNTDLTVVVGALQTLSGDPTYAEPVRQAILDALQAAQLALAATEPTGGVGGANAGAIAPAVVSPGVPGGGGGSGYVDGQ